MSVSQRIPTIRFCIEIFNNIHILEKSNHALNQQEQTLPGILSKFRDLLIRHHLNEKFGASLLHRHFPLKQQQILVELNMVTTPWTMTEADIDELRDTGSITYQSGKPYPTLWMFVEQANDTTSLMPYDFAYKGRDEYKIVNFDREEHQVFLQSLITILQQSGLQESHALVVLPDVDIDGAVESTIGQANILRLKGEHNVASPAYPSGCWHPHEVQASFLWPTAFDGKVPSKAMGSRCDGMNTCKCTVKGST